MNEQIERLIRDRYSALADKKLNKCLSNAELGEYQKLNRVIDAVEADFYEPAKKMLGKMLSELHNKRGDELHGQLVDNKADSQFLAKIPEFHPVSNPPFLIGFGRANIHILADLGNGYNIYNGEVIGTQGNFDKSPPMVFSYYIDVVFVCGYRLGSGELMLSDIVNGEVYYKLIPKGV
jgi:hypothetical protein